MARTMKFEGKNYELICKWDDGRIAFREIKDKSDDRVRYKGKEYEILGHAFNENTGEIVNIFVQRKKKKDKCNSLITSKQP